jgi:hypothetical protein
MYAGIFRWREWRDNADEAIVETGVRVLLDIQ